ncbi:hypothetical protein SAMN04883147_11372, partial [Streptomyces sp. DpondAA-F4]
MVLVLVLGRLLVVGPVGGGLVVLLVVLGVARLAPAAATATAAATAGGPVAVLVGLVTVVLGVGVRLGLVLVLGGEGDGGRGPARSRTASPRRRRRRREPPCGAASVSCAGAAVSAAGSAAGCTPPALRGDRSWTFGSSYVSLSSSYGDPEAAAAAAAVSGVWNIGSEKTGAWKTATAGRAARRPLRTGSSVLAVNSGRPRERWPGGAWRPRGAASSTSSASA